MPRESHHHQHGHDHDHDQHEVDGRPHTDDTSRNDARATLLNQVDFLRSVADDVNAPNSERLKALELLAMIGGLHGHEADKPRKHTAKHASKHTSKHAGKNAGKHAGKHARKHAANRQERVGRAGRAGQRALAAPAQKRLKSGS